MQLDFKRILRTLIQSASGAGVALLTAVANDWSRTAIITALVSFLTTVGIAVLMNIHKQISDGEEVETDVDNQEDIYADEEGGA